CASWSRCVRSSRVAWPRVTEQAATRQDWKGPSGPFLFSCPGEFSVAEHAAAPADPDLAFGVDLQDQLRVAAHLAALADPEAFAQRAQRPALIEEGSDRAIGGAGGWVFGDADSEREGTHDHFVVGIAGDAREH